jgi:hypothetical protein
MARREQTGSGGARNSHQTSSQTSGGRSGAGKGRGRSNRRARSSHPAARRATHAPSQAQRHTATSGAHPTAGSAWSGVGGVASPTPLLTLSVEHPLAGATLMLAGAEQGTLHDALQAWGAMRDQAANRIWRRPGGLTRMAGL